MDFLQANVEELSQVVGFLQPDKSLLIHGHNEAADMTELQTTLNGCLLEYVQNNFLREYWVPVEMTPLHLRQYCDILVQNYPNLVRNRRDQFSSQIPDVVVKLRQVISFTNDFACLGNLPERVLTGQISG
jgi:hypothetical protein